MPVDRYAFLRHLDLFAGERHQPFRWSGGGSKAVLLVHGFPGTPADMRPLGAAFNQEGWTVDAPLLPGFGPQIATLPERRNREWVAAVRTAYDELAASYSRVVIVGHSLGASVALLAGVERAPAAQVLLSPYWRFGGAIRNALWPVLRLWAGRWRPLGCADFDDDHIRNGILRIVPDLDIDDEGIRTELRGFTVPTRLLDELRKLGGATRKAARKSTAPTLVVQGLRDTLVQPRDTDILLRAIPDVRLELLDATHNVPNPEDGAWERVRRVVLEFAQDQAGNVGRF